ncbi:MAG TPA: ABC transporter permease [Pyrinomonadaceae bacterium]|nr:ABC transporter permease [Pyrinomonadaceae bacterium]
MKLIEQFGRDLGHSARMLLKRPGFTFVAIVTLALGIGANTAIFSLVRGVLLRPLPFSEPERLIGIRESKVGEGHNNPMAWRSFAEFRDKAQTLESIAAYLLRSPDIEHGDGRISVETASVSHTYFKVFGVHPMLGRDFTPEDNQRDGPQTAILSYELWQQLYGGDQEIVGKSVRMDAQSVTIVGVMPPINVGEQIGWRRLWTPLRVNETTQLNNSGRWVQAVARLKPGVTIDQAQAELTNLIDGLKQHYPATHSREHGVYATALKDHVVDEYAQRALWVLFGAVVLVLLIACANVANLSLAQAAVRERELAVRTALGASRFALVRLLLSESMLLLVGGIVAGWLLAQWLLTTVLKFSPEQVSYMGEIKLDAGVLVFTLVLSVLTGLIFGLAPVLSVTKVDLNVSLKDGARAVSGGRRQHRLRSALIVFEVALALILLTGSGLLLKSFVNLRTVELGFNPDRLLTMRLRLPFNDYKEPERRVSYFQQTLANLQVLPGVEAAAICFSFPMGGGGATDRVWIEGQPDPPRGEEPVLRGGSVSADYFKTMGIPFRHGRTFSEEEVWQGRPVIIVNEKFSRRFFGAEDPIGKRIKVGPLNAPYSTIVGVVANHIQPGADNLIWEEMFYPYVNTADPPLTGMNLVVKTSGDPAAMSSPIVNETRKLERLLTVTNVRTMDELRRNALQSDRFNLGLMGSFAILALLLAALGIYGVMSYTTAQRTRELGIRLALGAQTRSLLKLVTFQGMKLALIGMALGLLGSFALTRLMSSLLFGVEAHDPLTFVLVALLLAVVAFIACYIPARRATRVDPLVALRCE